MMRVPTIPNQAHFRRIEAIFPTSPMIPLVLVPPNLAPRSQGVGN